MKKALVCLSLWVVFSIVLIVYDQSIIDFLSQYETTNTLLKKHPDFWNERIHDWLGDTITLVGVMLAFSLPFTAQVIQWVVATYGVTTFPEIVKNKLKINRLLIKMFIFVGLVIFWRVFIYDISPYTSSLYIVFNFIIAICFVWILCRLFKVIYYVLRCTFEFRNFIIIPAYKYIKSVTDSIPTPYSEIKDLSVVQNLAPKYLQNMELLRDDEMASFKRGNIVNTEIEGFEKYTWQYILALLTTGDLEKIKQGLVLHSELSASIKSMSVAFSKEYYARYVRLASSLVGYCVKNRYYILDYRIIELENNANKNIYESPDKTVFTDEIINEQFEHQLWIDKKYKEKESARRNFYSYISDVIFLAEEIEGKKHQDYYPILSCRYLMNHSSFGYLYILPKNIDKTFDWKTAFERIDVWEKDIIELTKRLIQISSQYQKTSALLDIYHNLRNDLQFSHQREIHLYSLERRDLKSEDYDIVYRHTNQFAKILNPEQVVICMNFLYSEEFDKYFNVNDQQKGEIFQKLLRIRYKFRVNDLLLFWLGYLSFDTSVVINILEEASPMDIPNIHDIGEHLIPVNIDEVFRKYLIVSNLEYEYYNSFVDLDRYQVVFSTMVLYFLAKSLRDSINPDELPFSIVHQIYHMNELSIRNVKSLREIAKIWLDSPKDIENNQGIRQLCLNYGISFDNLLKLYEGLLKSLSEQSDDIIQKKIHSAPIDEGAIAEFYEQLNCMFKELLQDFDFDIETSNDYQEKKKFRFTSINREWFINEDTGVHYVRDTLDQEFFYKCKYFLNHQKNKIMVVFDGTQPVITFEYKSIGDKLVFYCEYNFYFK